MRRCAVGCGWLKATAFCFALAFSAVAEAATSYFIEIPGIPGGSTVNGRAGWIDAAAFGAAVSREKSATRANLPSVAVTKRIDKASPLLNVATTQAQKFKQVKLDTVDTTTGQIVYRVILRDVLVSNVFQAVHGNVLDSETVLLDFSLMSWSYTTPDDEILTGYADQDGNTGNGPPPAATPVPDADGDGISDQYENANGLNPSVNDATGDLDGDGATNFSEYVARTRANDATSIFRVSGVTQPDGSMRITWNSVPNKIYHLLGSTSPAGPYTIVKQNIVSEGDGETSTTVEAPGAVLFYRVRTQ